MLGFVLAMADECVTRICVQGLSPLHIAAVHGHKRVADLLIDAGTLLPTLSLDPSLPRNVMPFLVSGTDHICSRRR